MSNIEKSNTIGKNAHTAMRHYLDNRLVPIITTENEMFKRMGSGTCIRIKDKYFIFSAGHVIKNHKNNNESLLLGSWDLNSPNVTDFIKTDYIDDDENIIDIGYIEISKDNAKTLGKIFVDFEVIKTNVCELKNDEVLVSGYPDEIRSVEEKGKFNVHTVRASHYRGRTIPTIEFPLHLSLEKHIVIKYPEFAEDSLGKKIKLPDAPGISGGSIWAMNAKTKGIWSPDNTNFIGIQISWHPKNRYLVGMQIQFLINLIKKDYKNLID